MFNLMEELFAPGRKHTDEERQRLALTREDVGDGDPYRGPIDLASGKVTIRVPVQAGDAPSEAASPDEASSQDAVPEEAVPAEAVPADDASPHDSSPGNSSPGDGSSAV
ncbi:DUF6191 domain-containing protein [Streptomyces roseicoloratus]|uniref:DUF6191 domain-containing protein n=1 Tax=Streptomyces roseicoloratus TaxID=2508722 RepID=A0ABY9RT98_9ACTN|nr:DUF6191 domain-containing protein [Streptomyces roseicoloratus]WMX44929.1 DUF6191 domain-containing protein [Streptomyces roseicoloratus]